MLPPLKRPRAFVSTANVLSLVGMGAVTGSPDLRAPSTRQALQACSGIAKAASTSVRCSSVGLHIPWLVVHGLARPFVKTWPRWCSMSKSTATDGTA